MMPSAEDMLLAAQTALRDFVTPVVEDQWASSALRSVDVILSHLAARTAIEGPMLYEDNRDLVAVLAGTAAVAALADGPASSGGTIAAAIAVFEVRSDALLQGYPPVAELAAVNLMGRELVDDLLVACHALAGDAGAATLHDGLRAYLMRHVERESPLFFPIYVGRPV